MPTRNELLAGFVPQNTPVRECMICQQEPPTNPVTTQFCQCRVVYCRDCLLRWFETSSKCVTCPVHYYDEESDDSSTSEDSASEDSEDEDSEDQEDEEVYRPNGGPPIKFYLLNSTTGAAERTEALETIIRFRAFQGQETGEASDQGPQPSASIEAYLMIDAFLQEAMIIYGIAIRQIPWNSEIGSIEKFIKLVTSLGHAIIQLDGRRGMTSTEVGRELINSALVDLGPASPGLAEICERYLEQDTSIADWDSTERYMPYLAKKMAKVAERIYSFRQT